jgi:hypothetical protein
MVFTNIHLVWEHITWIQKEKEIKGFFFIYFFVLRSYYFDNKNGSLLLE